MGKIFISLLVVFWFVVISLNFTFNRIETHTLELALKKREKLDHYISSFAYFLSMMKDAETGQRGYTITGDKIFLEPYNRAVEYLNAPTTAQLFIEAKKDLGPSISNKLIQVQKLQNLKMNRLEQIIEERTNIGFEAAQKSISSRIGKIWMDEIRGLFAEILSELDPMRKAVVVLSK